MDTELINLMNRVPDVLSFSGKGHSRLFNRKTEVKQASKNEASKGRVRRTIEEIKDERERKSQFDYL
ncbi:hypothetical protein VPHD81_0012 [Vibrio phage D81]